MHYGAGEILQVQVCCFFPVLALSHDCLAVIRGKLARWVWKRMLVGDWAQKWRTFGFLKQLNLLEGGRKRKDRFQEKIIFEQRIFSWKWTYSVVDLLSLNLPETSSQISGSAKKITLLEFQKFLTGQLCIVSFAI